MARTGTIKVSCELLKELLHLPETFQVLAAQTDHNESCINFVVGSPELDDRDSDCGSAPILHLIVGVENLTWSYV